MEGFFAVSAVENHLDDVEQFVVERPSPTVGRLVFLCWILFCSQWNNAMDVTHEDISALGFAGF